MNTLNGEEDIHPSLRLYDFASTDETPSTEVQVGTTGETDTSSIAASAALMAQHLQYEIAEHEEAKEVEANTSAVKLVQYTPGARPQRLGRPRPAFQSTPPVDSVINREESKVSMFRFDKQPVIGPGSRGGKIARPARGIITKARRTETATTTETSETNSAANSKVDQKNASKSLQEIGDVASTSEEKVEASSEDTSTKVLNEVAPTNGDVGGSESISKEKEEEETTDNLSGSLEAQEAIVSTTSKSENIKNKLNKSLKGQISSSGSTAKNQAKNGSSKKKASFTSSSSSGRPLKQAKLAFPSQQKSSPTKATKSSSKQSTKSPTKVSRKLTLFIPKQTARQSKGVSRTTVPNTLHKVTRQLPGPLVGLGYNLYDEQHFGDQASSESISFGYEVSPAPYASDIVLITQFLLKFKDIVNIELGPQDLEEGMLGSEISPLVTRLVLQLLSLVLNRKRAITSLASAISELKPLAAHFGFPKEWKEPVPPSQSIVNDFEVLDPKNPQILPGSLFPPNVSTITYNPFGPAFEREGLLALEPPDRIVFVRTLCQWAFSSSEQVKSRITSMIQSQDIPGDKETHYVARSVLNGIVNTVEAKKQAESKLAKREDDVKYVDPTSDPLRHCFRLRLDELVVGDCGFHVGRFYLCKMGGVTSGGLGSVAQMKSAQTKASKAGTRFKLYVQDVHQMLLKSLNEYGVEFNEAGEEVESKAEASAEWFEVASDAEQMAKFIEHLEVKLPELKRSLAYLPTRNMYAHLSAILPILERQADIEVEPEITEELESLPEKRTRGAVNYEDAAQYEAAFEEYQPEYIIEDDDEEYVD